MKVHNFSGGPGALPESVLTDVQEAIGRAPGSELGVLGISHRSRWFRGVLDEAEDNIRTLAGVSDDYEVLFLQGGASLQFSMIPMALLRGRSATAEYVVGGYWSGKAVPEARREGRVRVAWSGESRGFSSLPRACELRCDPNAAYFHYVSNETVEGLQFHEVPGLDGVRRVCDMSSDFLSRPIEAMRFAVIYAHAQKNLGPAGVTVAIVRRDVIEDAPRDLPAMLDFRQHAAMRSIHNTPPVFAIFVTMLVTRWLRAMPGGLQATAACNASKAQRLYDVLDKSDGFYRGLAEPRDRSQMNVTFRLPSEELERRFVAEAERTGLYGLEGHRTVGGIRASLYNAVELQSVLALGQFMEDFRERAIR